MRKVHQTSVLPLIFTGFATELLKTHAACFDATHRCRRQPVPPAAWSRDAQRKGSLEGAGRTSQLGTTHTQTRLAGVKPEGARIWKKCSPPALWKERGKQTTQRVLLGVPR